MYAKNQLSKEADSGKLQFDEFLDETTKQNQKGFIIQHKIATLS